MISVAKKTSNLPEFGFLLDGLRQQGLVVGTGDVLKVQGYFDTLWENEHPLSITDLKGQLAALVCKNRQQQQQFHAWFDQWAVLIRQRTNLLIDFLEPEAIILEPTEDVIDPTPDVVIDEPTPLINTPISTPSIAPTLPKPFQKSRTGPVNIQLVFPINDERIWNIADLDAVLPVLREKKWLDSTEWDILASIEQTIQLGGIPEFVRKQRRQTPQYLMLIEQQSNRDHLAAFYAELAEELGRRDLNVSYFYYDITPAVCWRARSNPRTHVSLEQLQSEYADARLFIVGHAETLLKSPRLEPSAVAISIWETWPETAILNPKGTGDWGKAELAIGQLFPVIPVNNLGFQSLMEQWRGAEHYTPTYWQIRNPEPRTPNVAEFGTLPRSELANQLQITLTPDAENKLNLLYFYLRDSGYRWLCATTLYPEMYYQLTRLYADAVIAVDPKFGEVAQNQVWWEALRLLVRLEWFRKGTIPTYWRHLLREDFTVAQGAVSENPQFGLSVKAVRERLLDILKLTAHTEGVASESYAGVNQTFTKVWLESELADNLAEMPQKMEEAGIYMSDIEDGVGRKLWFQAAQKQEATETTETTENIKTLHALIIGINNYPIRQHRLLGCVNDAIAVSNYLKEFSRSEGLRHSERRLMDVEATRENIVHGFTVFEEAKDGDICVFYFAGHGSTMKSPPEFWDEPYGFSQTFVCYDSRKGEANCRDLADKELGYLIHKATKGKDLHFLAITDCTTSWENTRVRSSEDNYGIRTRTVETCPTSPQDVYAYEGSKEWKNFQPPATSYVRLSAAKQDETAKEIQSRGAFTTALIEVLNQATGNINYSELANRARIKVRNRVQNQTPALNVYGQLSAEMPFLGGKLENSSIFKASYKQGEGWTVNAGLTHGLPVEGATFRVAAFGEIDTETVFENYSKLLVKPDTIPQGQDHEATLLKFKSAKFRVVIAENSDKDGAAYFRKYFQNRGDADLELVDDAHQADYWVYAKNGFLQLSMSNQTQPLFKRVKGYDDNAVYEFLSRCTILARWRVQLELSNPPNTTISDRDVDIQIRDGKREVVDANRLVFRQPSQDAEVIMELSVTNRSNRPLFISAVYYGSDCSITNQFLRSENIKSGETAWLQYENKKEIPMYVYEQYMAWGANEREEYFKVFVSENRLDTDKFNQDGVPLDSREVETTSRGMGFRRMSEPLDNWRTFERTIRIIAPYKAVFLASNKEVTLVEAVKVSAPTGFSAEICLSTTVDARRFDDMINNARFGDYTEPVALLEGMANSPIVDVIEIFNVTEIKGKDTLSKENPLRIEIPNEKFGVVAVGYDAEKGRFMPISTQNTEGVILIEQLPSTSSDGKLKLFFRRTPVE